MKAITNSIIACCCLLLLIGCHKEQQNESGITQTRWDELNETVVASFHVDGYEYEYIGADGYLEYYHKDDYDYYLYFKITRDTLNQHELCCIGGEEIPIYYKGGLFLDSLLIPEKIIVNIPFGYGDGYRTVTFTVTGIGDEAFKGCSSLTSITLPNSIQEIGPYAFKDCSSLTSITLPNSLQIIDPYAFEDCLSLTSITLPGSIQEIGVDAFSGCPLETINFCPGIETIGEDAFNNAFGDCSSVSVALILPEGLKYIGNKAFANCSSFTSITLPNSLQEIGPYAFENCSSLTSITLPNSIQEIGSYAFANCSSLTSITLPNSIQEIGSYAFVGSSITSIMLPSSIQKISDGAFSRCPLETISFYPGIETIGEEAFFDAFWGCSSESVSLILPEGLKHIGKKAFAGCDLTNCTCYAVEPPILDYNMWPGHPSTAFPFNNFLQAIYVPRESVEAYKYANGWYEFANIIYPIE